MEARRAGDGRKAVYSSLDETKLKSRKQTRDGLNWGIPKELARIFALSSVFLSLLVLVILSLPQGKASGN